MGGFAKICIGAKDARITVTLTVRQKVSKNSELLKYITITVPDLEFGPAEFHGFHVEALKHECLVDFRDEPSVEADYDRRIQEHSLRRLLEEYRKRLFF